MMHNSEKIDFVILWVDSNDPKWQEVYKKYKSIENGDQREFRFRDMDTLRFWFRGIENNAPWVNNVFFITNGQFPNWLNLNHPKLRFVKHSDYIPSEYLPTFSSHTIELNLHRIKDLSENFVYFNDDTFLINPAKQTDFFKGGYPKLCAIMDSNVTRDYPPFLVPHVNASVLNRNFEKKDVLKHNFTKFFNLSYKQFLLKNIQFSFGRGFYGFKMYHLPAPMLKSTIEEVWEKEEDILHTTCSHRFRQQNDVNQWLFQNWQICKGDFFPQRYDIGSFIPIQSTNDLKRACDEIQNSSKLFVCPNDASGVDFYKVKKELHKALNEKFPNKSSYEL